MEGQPRATTRPASGIPRLAASRLPLPTSTASKSIRPSPSRDRLQADPGLDHARLRRPSYESLLKKPTPRYSLPAKSVVQAPPKRDDPQTETNETQTPEHVSLAADEEDDELAHEPRGRLREERPSLSERTIETLAQIPPSPASVKRQSSFYNGASPIRSPSRTPSNVSTYSRSPSRSSSGQANGNDLLSQPVSKLRLPSHPRISVASASSLSSGKVSDAKNNPSKMRSPSARQSLAPGGGIIESSTPLKKGSTGKTNALGGTPAKASPSRPSLRKKPSKPALSKMGPPERPLQVKKTRKSQTDSSSSMRSPSTASRYLSAASTLQEELTPDQQAENEARKASKSSSALRESIAKAKAAKKAATSTDKPAPQAKAPVKTWESVDDEDPFNQLPKGSNTAVLKKRVEGARTSGTLNIAAMSLTEIPKEVINMYEFDSETSSNWFENVDLVKFIAADNELVEVADDTFPDIDPVDFNPDSDERGPQFGALETLDLHGNKLQALPVGLRRLHQLRFLNLSNNELTLDKLEIIMEIPSLVDLKLVNNKLEGSFPSKIGRLRQLEGLDLRSNALTKLPKELSELTCLKTLDVGENQLTSLPFEALSKLPLKTLNAPKNNLEGTLIPGSVDRLEHLQSLNIANNSVEALAANEMISLPNLHSLIISVNRIKCLPSVSSWQSLSVLAAEVNRLAEIPAGFVELKNLKTVDFTGNNITRLDEKIGLMNNLSTFKIANNPLRERKFLSMGSDEIIQDLRNRCEPEPQDTDDEGSVATQFTLAPETPALESGWRVKPGGILDMSYSDLTDLGASKMEMINWEDVRCLYLQHNEMRFFPLPVMAMLAHGLTELDLSHNPLHTADLMPASVELPKLQSLNLSAASLTSLEPLLTKLQAPLLNFLDVSNNRLTGSLPHIRQTYPEVKTFLASDNQIASVEFEAVQGLQVLDISNNDIDHLPPKIGLLGADRSPKNWGTGSPLKRFEVAGNRFRVPRWQVVAKGTDAVMEYLKEHIPTQDLPEWEQEDAAAPADTF
ncbi:uncharacterized protein N7482_001333 [Penicillium canariense]|uniref:Leucine-rich repeat, typical subtype n=1 Tax=Penicillium canariense TaxID=189055 RepID=A0A9W9IGY9_9EURO|nr:uncharacterized protein N7482_001333 [Penicillium canariense]KAJ5175456.1 hypothetical protein N7482_001333 [Penicillium canariense]